VLIVDTNVFVASADEADPDHVACATVVEGDPGPLVTTALVIAEAGWLIERQLGPAAEAEFYRSVADGDVRVEDLTDDDWIRVTELVELYADLGLGGVDASVITIAERLQQTRIATLDHRDFRAVRPSHCEAFELVPSPAPRA
jgi:predicted nucleic acid-binding protein